MNRFDSVAPAGTAASYYRPSLIEWLYLGLAVLAFSGYLGYSLYEDRLHIDARERERLTRQSIVVAENLGRQLSVINLALASTLKEVPNWRGQKDGTRFAAQHLKAMKDVMPAVLTLLVLDRTGTVEGSDKPELVGQNFAYREYFSTVQRNPKSATLYLSAPFKTAQGHFTMNLIRMIPGSEGQFDGMVVAALAVDEFRILLNSVLYKPDVRASLIHGDGTLFLTTPASNNVSILDVVKPGSFFARHVNSGQKANVFTGAVSTADKDRMVALQTIQPAALAMDKPLVIAVERGTEAMFAHWHEKVLQDSKLLGLLGLFAVMGMLFHQRWRRNFHSVETRYAMEHQRSLEALRQSEERFRSLTKLTSDWYWEQDDQFRFVRLHGQLDERTRAANKGHVGKTRWEMGAVNLTEADWEKHRAVLQAHQEFHDFELQRLDNKGNTHWLSISGTPLFDGTRKFCGYRGVARDITAQKLAEDEIKHLAFYDTLTQLPNRKLLNDRLGHACAASRRSRRYGALMFLDLDNFKPLNDVHGHEAGDLLLIEVAKRITQCLREVDTVARFGGDEFAVILGELDTDVTVSHTQAGIVAEKIRTSLAEPYLLTVQKAEGVASTATHYCSASIGVALFLDHEATKEQLLKAADVAMYRAKESGRNQIRFSEANTLVAG
jgi:diguanylate cyclase (GGDEF)-like protein/PAS domain S-box-containing protein